jgi:hypothetical protein
MSVFKVQLSGGNFQDVQGNLLNLGYLMMKLSADEEVNDSLICSGIEIRIQLDANGNVSTSPAQSVWGNDQMSPVNSFYKVTGYTASGQIAFGPNNQQVTGSGGVFDVGLWVPNHVISWVPSVQSLSVQIAGTALGSQSVLDFINTGNVIFTDVGSGQISASVTGSGSGTVTHTPGPLTLNAVILGNGSADIKAGAVLPADATKFYDGTGAFSVPAGGGAYLIHKQTITASQILNLRGNAAVILPAQGPGTIILVNDLILYYKFNSIAYDNSNAAAINIQFTSSLSGAGTGNGLKIIANEATTFLTASSSQVNNEMGGDSAVHPASAMTNVGIYLVLDVSDPGSLVSGDGTIEATITYLLLTA